MYPVFTKSEVEEMQRRCEHMRECIKKLVEEKKIDVTPATYNVLLGYFMGVGVVNDMLNDNYNTYRDAMEKILDALEK